MTPVRLAAGVGLLLALLLSSRRAEHSLPAVIASGRVPADLPPELAEALQLVQQTGFGFDVPIFDYDTQGALRARQRAGVVAFDLDGTTACPRRSEGSRAAAAYAEARRLGFAVVIITARPLPANLPQAMRGLTDAVYYNSSGTDVARTKLRQLRHARRLFARAAPLRLCLLVDDNAQNVAVVRAAGASAELAVCGEVGPELVAQWARRETK